MHSRQAPTPLTFTCSECVPSGYWNVRLLSVKLKHIFTGAILTGSFQIFAYGNSWAHDGEPLADTLSGISVKKSGSYRLDVVSGNCTSHDECLIKLPEIFLSDSAYSVYPNPVTSAAWIRFPSRTQASKILVTDAMGRKIGRKRNPRF